MRSAARENQPQFWKSASFNHLINRVALGDVDGDGKIETATIAPHAVLIYRSESGASRKIAEIEESINLNLIGVDSADINENGYAEIFVTLKILWERFLLASRCFSSGATAIKSVGFIYSGFIVICFFFLQQRLLFQHRPGSLIWF